MATKTKRRRPQPKLKKRVVKATKTLRRKVAVKKRAAPKRSRGLCEAFACKGKVVFKGKCRAHLPTVADVRMNQLFEDMWWLLRNGLPKLRNAFHITPHKGRIDVVAQSAAVM